MMYDTILSTMNIFPTEIVNLILEYQGYHKNRNGKYMRQLYLKPFKKIRNIPKLNYVYQHMGHEVNFTKQIIPEFVYDKIYEAAYEMKQKESSSIPTALMDIPNIDHTIQNIYEIYEMYMNVKFTIKPIVRNDEVVWTMNTYYLIQKNYTHRGNIYNEETLRSSIGFTTHK